MEGLFLELPVGLQLNGETLRDVELLRTNGVAEKVFVKKLPEKPFTWQGNVISIAVKSIGSIEIGAECRQKNLTDGSVTIPKVVRSLTLADVNTLLVEIHRRVWVSFIPKQEIICKYCGRKLIADIDLDKIDFLPEVKESMEGFHDYRFITVDLGDGFQPPVIPKLTDKEEYSGIVSNVYNRFVFRAPLLDDAINQEKYFSDSIGFWRRLAMDCLVAIQVVKDGVVVEELPREFHIYYGLKIFNEVLSGRDLKAIRNGLTEELPTLPYAYFEECPHCDNEIPMTMEVSNFFSE